MTDGTAEVVVDKCLEKLWVQVYVSFKIKWFDDLI